MISEIIEKWIKGILIDGITGNLSGLFDNVNAKVGEIASDVGSTPQAWNSGIFNMLRSLSETVVLPIAAAILALVMCHELIQMITEKNNMHDFDTSMFFRWIFKSAFAILIVSNTWNIVMGVFDATQSVVNQSSGVIIGETSIHFDRLIPGLEFQLESMTIGSLLSLWFQTLVVGLTMNILSICIFLVTYGRMIEIYVVTALGPIPLATMGSSEWRSTGQNYLKSLLALGFQAFLIMIVVGIYAVLIPPAITVLNLTTAYRPLAEPWTRPTTRQCTLRRCLLALHWRIFTAHSMWSIRQTSKDIRCLFRMWWCCTRMGRTPPTTATVWASSRCRSSCGKIRCVPQNFPPNKTKI